MTYTLYKNDSTLEFMDSTDSTADSIHSHDSTADSNDCTDYTNDSTDSTCACLTVPLILLTSLSLLTSLTLPNIPMPLLTLFWTLMTSLH